MQEVPASGGIACETRVGSLIDNNMRAIIFDGGFVETTFEAITLGDFNNFQDTNLWGDPNSSQRLPMVVNLFSTFADWRTSDRMNTLMTELLRTYMSTVRVPWQLPTMIVGSHVDSSPVLDLALELNRQPSGPGRNITCSEVP